MVDRLVWNKKSPSVKDGLGNFVLIGLVLLNGRHENLHPWRVLLHQKSLSPLNCA